MESCDISSDSLACVAIHGNSSNPTIRDCKIHDSKQEPGVVVFEQGQGTIEGCDIFANRATGVAVGQGSNPTIRNCKIHDSKEGGGVYVCEQAKGTIEGCDIFANELAGVEINQGGTLTVRHCKIHDNDDGVYVRDQAKGTVEGCDIFANEASGVNIVQGGDPIIRNCKIHDSKQGCGVVVGDYGKGTVEGCDIFANELVGVEIEQGGNPVIRNCTIYDNEGNGVYVCEQGKGAVKGCDIFANKLSGVSIGQGADPTVCDCKIHHNRESGLYAQEGKGTVEGCDIFANELTGVEIWQGGDPTVRDCKIHHSKEGGGLYVAKEGKGLVEGCEIFANKLAGVKIAQGGDPTIRDCKIHDDSKSGVIPVCAACGADLGPDVTDHCPKCGKYPWVVPQTQLQDKTFRESLHRTSAPAAEAKAEAANAYKPPALPGDVKQFYFPTVEPRPIDAQLEVYPLVLEVAKVVYLLDKHAGTEHIEVVRLLAQPPAVFHPAAWETAWPLTGVVPEGAPPPDARWVGVPESMDSGRKLKALEKAFAEHLYATRKLLLWENLTLGLLGRPGETEADFRKCCKAAAEEEKKHAMEIEKVKFRPKFDSLGASLPDEKPKKSAVEVDADDPKVEEKRRKLTTDYQSKVWEITEKWKRVGEEATAIQVKPRKADVHVTHFGLAWAPYWRTTGPGGQVKLAAAYR